MKIKTLMAAAIMAVCGMNAMAQTDLETFQFVDKNGNVVADGSVVTVNTPEKKDGVIQISSGLYVKNTTSEEQAIGLKFSIDRLDNGAAQCCFPAVCTPGTDHVGKYEDIEPNLMEANDVKSFETEWIPVTYGECNMTFQILVNKIGSKTIPGIGTLPTYDEFKAYGPKITVNFIYLDPTSVNGVTTESVKPVAYYNLGGMQINTPQRGVNIVLLSNGKTVKIVNK